LSTVAGGDLLQLKKAEDKLSAANRLGGNRISEELTLGYGRKRSAIVNYGAGYQDYDTDLLGRRLGLGRRGGALV
jgi:hypothetical protein